MGLNQWVKQQEENLETGEVVDVMISYLDRCGRKGTGGGEGEELTTDDGRMIQSGKRRVYPSPRLH